MLEEQKHLLDSQKNYKSQYEVVRIRQVTPIIRSFQAVRAAANRIIAVAIVVQTPSSKPRRCATLARGGTHLLEFGRIGTVVGHQAIGRTDALP